MGGNVLDYPEKTAYLEGQKDQRKKDEEEWKCDIRKRHDQFIRRQIEKGLSEEEAEAEYSLTFPDDEIN
uniref:hypothetical protein n=1 Tax=Eubacterium cellulosolvens TaxID=29322 RepID=UPI000487F9BF|nr:hypothetical protein [[Eubacterium] cellulosolvens]